MARVATAANPLPELGHAVPRLLLIEPEGGGRRSIAEVLAGAADLLQLERVRDLDSGVCRLRETSFTAILLDVSVPEVRDLSAIDRLRALAPDAAIMMLASAIDQPLARRAVERGASDFAVTDSIDALGLCELIAMMFERRGRQRQQFVERERAEITLNSIGDAVLTTDTQGRVTYLNAEAELLTGWTRAEAFARPLADVFDVTDAMTGKPADDPASLAIARQARIRGAGNFVIVGRGGCRCCTWPSTTR